MTDLFLTNTHLFTSHYYCDVFISRLDSHSDGTHSLELVTKWCNAKFLQISFDKETNLDGLRASTFSANFHFWLTYYLKDGITYCWNCWEDLWEDGTLVCNLLLLTEEHHNLKERENVMHFQIQYCSAAFSVLHEMLVLYLIAPHTGHIVKYNISSSKMKIAIITLNRMLLQTWLPFSCET